MPSTARVMPFSALSRFCSGSSQPSAPAASARRPKTKTRRSAMATIARWGVSASARGFAGRRRVRGRGGEGERGEERRRSDGAKELAMRRSVRGLARGAQHRQGLQRAGGSGEGSDRGRTVCRRVDERRHGCVHLAEDRALVPAEVPPGRGRRPGRAQRQRRAAVRAPARQGRERGAGHARADLAVGASAEDDVGPDRPPAGGEERARVLEPAVARRGRAAYGQRVADGLDADGEQGAGESERTHAVGWRGKLDEAAADEKQL